MAQTEGELALIQGRLYGTASLKYVYDHDFLTTLGPNGHPGVILGFNLPTPEATQGFGWNPTKEQGHGLTLGATRSGKGVCAIIPALLSYSGSMVVIDPKGENAWVTAERRRQLGQRVVILDPWGEVNRRYAGGKAIEQATRFNPLSTLDPASPDFSDEVAAIADALIVTTGNDPFWTDGAREMVGGLVAAYVEARPGTATLRDVRRALLQPQGDFNKLVAYFQEVTPGGVGCLKLAGFTTRGEEESRTIESIRSTARVQTAFLDSTPLVAGMETDDPPFDLAELATGKVTLYLVLPLDRLQTHGRWLRLILTLAIRAIGRQARSPAVPVLFMLDEMGTIGRLAMVEQAFGLMAGVGVRIWGFLQDLNQLKRDYPESWETFIANSSIVQVLNARDETTSAYVSTYLGATTFQEDPEAVARKIAYKNAGYRADPAAGRPLLFPDEVRRIPANQVLILLPGDRPVMLYRKPYYLEPKWVGMYRPLPWFPPPVIRATPPPEPPKKKGWLG